MAENERDQELTPALIPIRTGTTIMIVLAVLTLVTWALGWQVYGMFLGISVAWFLFFVVGTTYVFHKARQAGEWPPPDRRDS
jgi:fatty acid desaturase